MVVPRTEVVLVKHYQIPVDGMYPLILGFDTAGVVLAEVVLKRAEADDRSFRVEAAWVATIARGEELPPREIGMLH